MRYILTAILACFGFNSFSQTQFEGRIEYSVTVPEKEKDGNGTMIIYFSKPGIRLELIDTKRPAKQQEIIIINLDSGKIFTLTPTKKEYKESLLKKKTQKTLSPKSIAGFNTTAVMIESFGMPKDVLSIFNSSVLYPADNLFYTVPDIYSLNPEIMMVNKGKVVLGADFYFPAYNDKQWNLNNSIKKTEEQQNLFSVVAEKIVTEKIASALFVVPSDCKKREEYSYYSDSIDSVYTMPDTTVPYLADTTYMVDSVYTPQQKTSAKKKKSTPQKKKSSTKQNPIRRKDE